MAERVEFNRRMIEEFHAHGGDVSRISSSPILLLTTTGARSGRSFTTPLVYTRDGERLVIIASKGGEPKNPDWYYNLVAHPNAVVELGAERFAVKAVVTAGEERQRLYDRQAHRGPIFAEYRNRTTRLIPVIALQRM